MPIINIYSNYCMHIGFGWIKKKSNGFFSSLNGVYKILEKKTHLAFSQQKIAFIQTTVTILLTKIREQRIALAIEKKAIY